VCHEAESEQGGKSNQSHYAFFQSGSPYLSTNSKEPERSLITIRMMLVSDAAATGYDVKEFDPESRGVEDIHVTKCEYR